VQTLPRAAQDSQILILFTPFSRLMADKHGRRLAVQTSKRCGKLPDKDTRPTAA